MGSLGQHHARIYAELERAELAGVYDVDRRRAQDVARRCRTRAFETPEALAAAVEAASVAVPTHRHRDLALDLLRRGLHLLVEKPIACSTAEAEEIVREAEARGRILQVGHVERFNPVMRFLEERLTRPRFIEATRLSPYPEARADGAPRGTDVSVVLDLMIHDLEILLHLVGAPVREIHAVGVPVLSASEDIANARLIFENGCVANVTASRISREKLRKIRVFQEDTYVSLDYMNQAGVVLKKEGGGITRTAVPIAKGEPLAAELAAFVECVLTHRDPLVTGRQASDALRLAAEICRQMRERPS